MRYLFFGALIGAALLAGSAVPASAQDNTAASPRPLGQNISSYKAPAESAGATDASGQSSAVPDKITLESALQLALRRNPTLQSYLWEVRAREAQALQEGLWPNPTLGGEGENLNGTGPFRGTRRFESTIALSQRIPLGGDLSSKRRAASVQADLADWEYEESRLDVFTSVTQEYVDVLAAREHLQLNEELTGVAEQMYQSIQAQVESGKTSPVELKRAEVVVSNAQIDLENAREELKAARQELASTWGDTSVAFGEVQGELRSPNALPSFQKLSGLIYEHPRIARFAAEERLRQEQLSVARSRRIPDPTVKAGLWQSSDVGERAFKVSVSIPLPVFDRSQGRIRAAQSRIEQVDRERRAARVKLRVELETAYRKLSAARSEVNRLEEEVVPAAESAYESIRAGYEQGKFRFLDVLDAQRSLFEARRRHVAALAKYNRVAAEVERLAARPLDEITSSK